MGAHLRRGLAWLEARTGALAGLREVLATPLPGRACLGRVSAALVALACCLQALTGVGLASYYAPGTTSSWASVAHIEEAVVLGSFLRGLHVYGASLVVVVLLLYLAERAWRLDFGGRLGWWLALLLIPLISAFSLTGYLLPWDQRGYWSTQVATSLVGATPLVGTTAQRVVQGGSELGQQTLTRAYTAHTVLLPALLALLGWVYLRVWRREASLADAPESPREPYWPRFAARDLVAFAAGALVVGLCAGLIGGHLEAPADPEVDFDPRPEWYFMALRQLLNYAPEPLGSHLLPGLAFLAWASLPWVAERRRALARGLVAAPLLAWALLLGLGLWADAQDASYQAGLARAAERARLARTLAREGVPAEGPAELVRRYPPLRGEALFAQECARCHALSEPLARGGPHLRGYLSLTWLAAVIKEPRHPSHFGLTKIDDMQPVDLPPAELLDLAAFVRSQDPSVRDLPGEQVARGRKTYFAQGCQGCHSLEPGVEDLGPNLHDYGSATWLEAFLRDPGAGRFYCDVNEMPRYHELPARDLDALVVFLRGLDGDPYAPPGAAAGFGPEAQK